MRTPPFPSSISTSSVRSASLTGAPAIKSRWRSPGPSGANVPPSKATCRWTRLTHPSPMQRSHSAAPSNGEGGGKTFFPPPRAPSPDGPAPTRSRPIPPAPPGYFLLQRETCSPVPFMAFLSNLLSAPEQPLLHGSPAPGPRKEVVRGWLWPMLRRRRVALSMTAVSQTSCRFSQVTGSPRR